MRLDENQKHMSVNTNEAGTKEFWCRKILGGHVKRVKSANETKKRDSPRVRRQVERASPPGHREVSAAAQGWRQWCQMPLMSR